MKKLLLILILTISFVNIQAQGWWSLLSTVNIQDGLVHGYNFDESSGDAIDFVGSSDATVVSCTRQQSTVTNLDYAYDFDGSNDEVQTNFNTAFDDFTIAAWIYVDVIDGGATNRIISKPPGASSYIDFYILNGGYLSFAHKFTTTTGVWRTTNSTISTGSWIHVAVSYNSGATTNNPIIYVNGVSQSLTEITTPVGTGSTDLSDYVIGSYTNSFNGKITQCLFWEIIVDSAVPLALYKNGDGFNSDNWYTN